MLNVLSFICPGDTFVFAPQTYLLEGTRSEAGALTKRRDSFSLFHPAIYPHVPGDSTVTRGPRELRYPDQGDALSTGTPCGDTGGVTGKSEEAEGGDI